jgi:Ca2+-binding EF-hand superfamily protein
MQKRTKIILASTVAVIFLVGAVGVSKAKEGFKGGCHGGHGFAKHDRLGGHGLSGMQESIFEKFDADKSGIITQTEIDGVRRNEIAKNDADKDGKLNLNEFQSLWTGLMRERMVDHFQRLDNDGDGVVSEDEIAKPMSRMMSFMDHNHDGTLSKDELQRRGRGHGKNHGKYKGGHHDDNDEKSYDKK